MRRGLVGGLALLILVGHVSAQSSPTIPYPRDYKTNLVNYAVVDRSDGMSRDLYASRDAIEALKRDPRLQEFPAGVLFALDVYSAKLMSRQGRRLRHAVGGLTDGQPASLVGPEQHRAKGSDIRESTVAKVIEARRNKAATNIGAEADHVVQVSLSREA